MEAALRLDDEPDRGPVADVEAAGADEVLVHRRVEVRVVGDVVDVAVAVVVHPPRRDGEEMPVRVARAAAHRLRPPRSSAACQLPAPPSMRSSSSSIQWRTGRRVPPARCVMQPMLALAITSGSPGLERRELVRPQPSGELGLQDRVGAGGAAAQVRVGHRRHLEARARAGSPRPRRAASARAAACTASGTRPRSGPWSIATSGAILRHSAPTTSTGSRASAAMRFAFVGVRRIVPQQVAVVLDHDAAAAGGDDDRLRRRARRAATRRRCCAWRARAPRRSASR